MFSFIFKSISKQNSEYDWERGRPPPPMRNKIMHMNVRGLMDDIANELGIPVIHNHQRDFMNRSRSPTPLGFTQNSPCERQYALATSYYRAAGSKGIFSYEGKAPSEYRPTSSQNTVIRKHTYTQSTYQLTYDNRLSSNYQNLQTANHLIFIGRNIKICLTQGKI